MIDVLIPVHNAEKTVQEAVSSILAQTVEDFRIIVVDDGSTDRTPEILRGLAAFDSRVVVIRKENGGIVDALNLGLSHCRAEFVARHDGDDIAYPERFATQIGYLRASPDCVAVGVNALHIDDEGRLTGGRSRMWGDAPADPTSTPSVEPYILHPFLMARRAALEAIGGYRDVLHAEDTDLYWRLRDVGRLHNLEQISGEYRMHSGSVSSRSAQNARICATTSQLAAVSARRRATGKADLVFPNLRDRYQNAVGFTGVLAVAAEMLDSDEVTYLKLAAAAKLVELRMYRRFRMSLDDIRAVASILWAGRKRLSRQDKRILMRNIRFLLRPKFGIKAMIARRRSKRHTSKPAGHLSNPVML